MISTSNKRVRTIAGLPALITAAGHDVPKELSEALASASWSTSPDDGLDTAQEMIAEAKDEDDWELAKERLAAALAIRAAGKSGEYINIIGGAVTDRILNAASAVNAGITEKAIAAFNNAAPAFVEAADATRGLELQEMSPEAVSPSAATAIAGLRAATDALNVQYALYDSIASLSGVAPAGMGSGPSVRQILARLAAAGDADLSGAEELLLAYGRGGQDRHGAVLPVAFAAPFVVVPDYGMTLDLARFEDIPSRYAEMWCS